ncbi:MAG: protein translocase subunit SecF [Pseudomonadota bacterium]
MSRRRMAVVVSVLLLAVSIGSLATQKLNFGIDFTGGILLELGYNEPADLQAIREQLAAGGYPDAQVQNFGNARDVLVRLPAQEGIDGSAVRENLRDVLEVDERGIDLRRVDFVGPQVGEELTEAGGLAMIFTLLMIFAYVMFRFQWRFAAGAVAALVHDVILTIGFFSIFQLPFDLSVLAAVLAVIGYSLNDTVVVFDRIRENFLTLRGIEPEETMNLSINQMLARTIITGVTTLLVLAALLVLGGEAIAPFSIALIVGIIVGTYSSIYIASATALELGVSTKDLLPPEPDDALDELP